MQDLTLTLVQTPLHWQDPARNAEMFLDEISFPERTDLVVLPEMFSTGFSMETHRAAEAGETALKICRELSQKTGAAVCGSSMFLAEDGRAKNRLIFQKPGEAPLFYDKRHLFTLAGEDKHYTPGHTRLIVEWKGWKIFPLVCYDLRFPVWSRRTKNNNYDLLLYSANWPDRRGYAWRTMAKARAIENQCYVAAVNRVGDDGNGMSHAGDSMLINYLGKPQAKAKPFATQVLTTQLSAEKLLSFRQKLPFFNDGDAFEIG